MTHIDHSINNFDNKADLDWNAISMGGNLTPENCYCERKYANMLNTILL